MFVENVTLYVKSKKISMGGSSIVVGPHGDFYGSSGTTQTIVDYLPEDQEAINLLKQTEVTYELVDLTICSFTTRLKARINGIKTPTLVLNGRKIIGIQNIKQALKDIET